MKGARANVGRTTVPMSGRNATRLSSTPQSQPAPYKRNEWGAADAPGSGPKLVPAPQATRPRAATPHVPRSGTREVARVDSAGLATAGQVTGTPAQPVQQPQPPSPPQREVYPGQRS